MSEEKTALLLPDHWSCEKHDRGLLIAASDNGFDFLSIISYNKEYGFEDIEIAYDVAFKRVEEVCDFFKGYQQLNKVIKKQKKETLGEPAPIDKNQQINEYKKKMFKIQFQQNEDGSL